MLKIIQQIILQIIKIVRKETYDINEFLVSLGTIIDEYDKIINSENENNNSNDRRYKKKQKGKK